MIKGLVLAATAAIGIGGAADASSYQAPFGTFEVDYKMAYAQFYCFFDCPGSSMIPRPYAGLGVGDVERGILTVTDGGWVDEIKVDANWSGGVIADGWNGIDVGDGTFWDGLDDSITFTKASGLISGFLFRTVFLNDFEGNAEATETY